MNSVIISVKSKKVPEDQIYKTYRDKFLAKCIYNICAFLFYLLGGAFVGTIAAVVPHVLFPNVEFHIYLAMCLVTAFIAIFPAVVLGYLVRVGIYKILCAITKK